MDQQTKEELEARRREARKAFEQTPKGQMEVVEAFRRWGLNEYENCRTSVVSSARWVDERGNIRNRTVQGTSGWTDVPADAVIRSNRRSRNERMSKLQEFIAVTDAMLAQLRDKKPLPDNYCQTLDDLMPPADGPDQNVTEIIRQPKGNR
ncbi:MAG: hypothetical protein HY695_30700 [Deltaproteobacteria bacterium]|nr:hypothetical protein [Deltaproteobacteria bacterium]